MVYGLIQSFRYALKYRGGWRGLIEHMYTVSADVVSQVSGNLCRRDIYIESFESLYVEVAACARCNITLSGLE